MTPLTRCDLSRLSSCILRPGMVLKVFAFLLALSSLAVAQTYLRFRTQDLQIETRKLQAEGRELAKRQLDLVEELGALKGCGAEEHAAMGLRACLPVARISVSAESTARWEALGRELRRRQVASEVSGEEHVLAALSQRLLTLSTPLMAGEPRDELE